MVGFERKERNAGPNLPRVWFKIWGSIPRFDSASPKAGENPYDMAGFVPGIKGLDFPLLHLLKWKLRIRTRYMQLRGRFGRFSFI
jgi:hypothetical protein